MNNRSLLILFPVTILVLCFILLWLIIKPEPIFDNRTKIKNSKWLQTTLTRHLDEYSTTIKVKSTSGFSAGDKVLIGTTHHGPDEIIVIGSITDSTTFSDCLRAQCNTYAYEHLNGLVVTQHDIPIT